MRAAVVREAEREEGRTGCVVVWQALGAGGVAKRGPEKQTSEWGRRVAPVGPGEARGSTPVTMRKKQRGKGVPPRAGAANEKRSEGATCFVVGRPVGAGAVGAGEVEAADVVGWGVLVGNVVRFPPGTTPGTTRACQATLEVCLLLGGAPAGRAPAVVAGVRDPPPPPRHSSVVICRV